MYLTQQIYVYTVYIDAEVCFRFQSDATSSRTRLWRRHKSTLLQELLTQDTRAVNGCREHVEEYSCAVTFASMGEEVKSPLGNGPDCFRMHDHIYHLVSPLYSDEENKPGCRKLYSLDSAQTTVKYLNTIYPIAEIMQRLSKMQRLVNPFPEQYKIMRQIKLKK